MRFTARLAHIIPIGALVAMLMVPPTVAAQTGTGADAAPPAWLLAAGLGPFRGPGSVGPSMMVALDRRLGDRLRVGVEAGTRMHREESPCDALGRVATCLVARWRPDVGVAVRHRAPTPWFAVPFTVKAGVEENRASSPVFLELGAGVLFPTEADLDIGGIVRFRRAASAYGDARLMVLFYVGRTGAPAP